MVSRENILNRIRKALQSSTENPIVKPDFGKDIYTKPTEESQEVVFVENFQKNNGAFYYCESIEDFLVSFRIFLQKKNIQYLFIWDEYVQELAQWGKITFMSDDTNFEKVEACLTVCDFLVARTGSILMSSAQLSTRKLSAFAPVHIVFAFTSQIVEQVKDALNGLYTQYPNQFPSFFTLITGPSRTADIEKTLVLGAHGPKELILFLIDDTNIAS